LGVSVKMITGTVDTTLQNEISVFELGPLAQACISSSGVVMGIVTESACFHV